MNIHGTPTRTIRPLPGHSGVEIIDQTLLPHRLAFRTLHSLEDAAEAISVMRVRGAPLIGATAAYGVALSLVDDASESRAGIGLCPPAGHPAHSGEPALGAGTHAQPPRAAAGRATPRSRLGRGRRRCATRT